eukprot:scaffold266_cov76-Skeletonema_menzelii.AAC.3
MEQCHGGHVMSLASVVGLAMRFHPLVVRVSDVRRIEKKRKIDPLFFPAIFWGPATILPHKASDFSVRAALMRQNRLLGKWFMNIPRYYPLGDY